MTSPRGLLLYLVLTLGLMVAGCSHAAKPARPSGPGLSGTVIYLTNAKLPATATIEIRLVELNRDGRVDRVITSETFPRPAAMPFEFWLPYQPGLISQRQSYGLDAKILDGSRTLFASTYPVPVLTRGHPKQVELVVAPVKK